MNEYNVIGLMSGTSLDGVDIAFCKFSKGSKTWNFQIIKAQTIAYKANWKNKLKFLENDSAYKLIKTHAEYGTYLGKLVNKFISRQQIKVDFISSHGHTIFHQPKKRITFQLGQGSAIAAECGLPVVCDFRSLDIALGGQGAPLVPIGDEMLFPDYDYCLNLGGFANISFKKNNDRIAFDICPVNIVINELCQALGCEFDEGGKIGKTGKVNSDLLMELNNLDFYKNPEGPKSLGKEWVLNFFYPLVNKYELNTEDKIRTIYEHVSIQIGRTVKGKSKKILLSGGGAYNTFLMERISIQTKGHKIIFPETNIIEFKEALIFAFLGVLRIRKNINCMKTVTGARKDSFAGCIYYEDSKNKFDKSKKGKQN